MNALKEEEPSEIPSKALIENSAEKGEATASESGLGEQSSGDGGELSVSLLSTDGIGPGSVRSRTEARVTFGASSRSQHILLTGYVSHSKQC